MLNLNRTLVICACCACMVPCEYLQAQLRGGAAADRPGVGGRIAARRDDRANRPPAQPTPAVAAAVSAAAAAARAAQLNPQRNNALGANAANTLPRNNAIANNPLVNGTAARNPANRSPLAVNPAAVDVRVSNYGAANLNARGLSPGATALGYGIGNPAYNNPAYNNPAYNNQVTTASATDLSNANRALSLPPNRLPYTGPGVLIRLPRELRGEVNYLVDDAEQMVVHSGEEQLLRLKGSYQVRFSRGVTGDGRSYGEARYTITEGIYRFDVSDNGWELYREADGSELIRRLEEFRQQESRQQELRQPETRPFESGDQSESPFSATARSLPDKLPDTPPVSGSESAVATPAATTGEETLPAPRSILEPN